MIGVALRAQVAPHFFRDAHIAEDHAQQILIELAFANVLQVGAARLTSGNTIFCQPGAVAAVTGCLSPQAVSRYVNRRNSWSGTLPCSGGSRRRDGLAV